MIVRTKYINRSYPNVHFYKEFSIPEDFEYNFLARFPGANQDFPYEVSITFLTFKTYVDALADLFRSTNDGD